MNYVTIATLAAFASYLFYTGIIPSISDSYRKVDIRFYHLFFGVVSVLVWLQSIYVSDAMDIAYGLAGFFLFCDYYHSMFFVFNTSSSERK